MRDAERLVKIRHILGEYVGNTDMRQANAMAHGLVPYIPWLLELVDNLQNAVNIYQPQVLELRKMEERVRELEGIPAMTYCAYCNEEFLIDDEAAEQVTQHIWTCPQHPMRGLQERIAQLEEQLIIEREEGTKLMKALEALWQHQ